MAAPQGLKQTVFGKVLETETLFSGKLQTPFLTDSALEFCTVFLGLETL